MAELDLRKEDNNLYSNIEEENIMPLFVRFSNKDVDLCNKNLDGKFEATIAQLSGIHECYFIHRRSKNRAKTFEELAIKVGDYPICINVQLSSDEITLRSPQFIQKSIILPEEGEYLTRKCEIRFVDFHENTFKLISSIGQYWAMHSVDITNFLKECFALPIPPIEIRMEEDKEMWQAYLDGLNALLESKRDLIKIQSVKKQKDNTLRVDFDKESYICNLQNSIKEELEGECESNVEVQVDGCECIIRFDKYQDLSEDTIESVKMIGRNYCYSEESKPINLVNGSISIVSNKTELDGIMDTISAELKEFAEEINRDETGEFRFENDNSITILRTVVENHFSGIAMVVNTTSLVVPLLPNRESINLEDIKKSLPEYANIRPYDKYFIISSKLPLDVTSEIFQRMKFSSCMVNVTPSQMDPDIKIEETSIKGNAYSRIVNNLSELTKIGRLYREVQNLYSNKKGISSQYLYAFIPQIEKSILQELKLHYYGHSSIKIDVPRSCAILRPKSQSEYNELKNALITHVGSTISAIIPEYAPTARIDFLSENEEYRREIFEKVYRALKNKKGKFTQQQLNHDAKELTFQFMFENLEERDEIERILEESLFGIHGIKICYEDNNKKGVTTWSLSEDQSLLQELDRKLQSEYRGECVNYIKGNEYDKLSDISDDEVANSSYTKMQIIKKKRYEFLRQNSCKLGTCIRRYRDYAIVGLTDEMLETMEDGGLQIRMGDYIQFPAIGEAMELQRQRIAMNRILKPANQYNPLPINPELPCFIFDPKYASETVVKIDEAKEDIRAHKLGNLNEKQLEAVTKSVLAKDLALIQGPPGTGKTTVIAEIIWQEIRKNPDCRILLTSQTNLAVDNALERLQGQPGIRPIRIGMAEKLEPEGRRFSMPIIKKWGEGVDHIKIGDNLTIETTDNAANIWMDRIVNNISKEPKYADAVSAWKAELQTADKHSRSEFCKIYNSNVNLVAATCSICGSSDFYYTYTDMFGECNRNNMYFDVVIMDEASKATPLEMAVPLVLGKKIIVIGDHKQLPPMMDENTIDSALEKIGRKDIAEKLQKVESQFKRLFEVAAKVRKTIVATLDTQYRMHEQIMNTIKQFYEEELSATGGLKCGIIETMDIPDLRNKASRWHGISFEPLLRPSTHAVWIDVQTPETRLNPGYKNEGELRAIDMVLNALQKSDGFKVFLDSQRKPEDKEIGIITFYSAQSREIKKKYKGKGYRIDAVDRFQGMERNIIIVSTVRSNPKNNIGFAKEIERINVAFSRARRLLIVIGNKQQFANNSNYATSISQMETISYEQLRDAVR